MKEEQDRKEKVVTEQSAAESRQEDKKRAKSQGLDNVHYRDSSGKTIFEDPILCAQFLKNYVDIPMLKDVEPEDIEDVTERYVHMFIEERNSDVVKKVHLKENSFYLVSLIEHKSNVDYNVVMQVFRYITFIWEDYEKEQEMKYPGISKTEGFCYPPILPILFYDGVENWTAATSLHERVLFSDVLGKYIPDYQCILIQLKEYSSAELMEKKNELSVIMMIDKLRNMEDYREFREKLDEAFLDEAIGETPEYLRKTMVQIIRMFLAKLNVSWEEVEAFAERIKERKMGELFKYFEGWDIQAVRKEANEIKEQARREAEEAKQAAKREVEEARQAAKREVEEARQAVKREVEEAKQEAEKAAEKKVEKAAEKAAKKAAKKTTEDGIRKLLKSIKKYHATRADAVTELMGEYELSRESAEEKVALYW